MSVNRQLDTLLETLDAADGSKIDRVRADADLHRILVSAPSQPALGQADPRRVKTRPRTVRRLAVLAGSVAAVTLGMMTLPPLSGGDPAFATWTAVPSGMTERERLAAADDCRESKKDVGGGMYSDDLAGAELAISEKRGAWTTVVLTGGDGFSALCITEDSSHLFGKSRTGSVGRALEGVALGPRELKATGLGVGTMGAGDISMAEGAAGADVKDVVYKSGSQGDVAATISKGRFALWLPGDDMRDYPPTGVEVTVTYGDGTKATQRLTL